MWSIARKSERMSQHVFKIVENYQKKYIIISLTEMETIQFTPLPEIEAPQAADCIDPVQQVIDLNMPGFVVRRAGFRYKELLSEVDAMLPRQGAMPFNRQSVWSGEADIDADEWAKHGITPLHVDGYEGDNILSVSHTSKGAYDIRLFGWGAQLASEIEVPQEVWDVLQPWNMPVLSGEVDADLLNPEAHIASVGINDILVINPSLVHITVATDVPRFTSSEFFYQ